jgi:hypothetical protein
MVFEAAVVGDWIGICDFFPPVELSDPLCRVMLTTRDLEAFCQLYQCDVYTVCT